MFKPMLNISLVSLICLLSTTSQAELTDPMQPQWSLGTSNSNGAKKPTKPSQPDVTFILQGVSIIGSNSKAKINNVWLKPNERLSGARLLKIGPATAVIIYKGKRKTLTLYNQKSEISVVNSLQETP